MVSATKNFNKIMILGSGELGRELTISLKRLGKQVIAVDNYANAPAMQVADHIEVINMLDGDALESVIKKHHPDLIVPEVEAIRTEKLIELEAEGFNIIPNAKATYLTMNRIAIREMAAKELGIRTARYEYAESELELKEKIEKHVGLPCVVKPVMSSSGKGQSVITTNEDVSKAWIYACEGMRGDLKKVIVEEFIHFESEITILTIRQRHAPTLFVRPIGHRQVRGDYQESWMPAIMTQTQIDKAQAISLKVTDKLGGHGLFGVEFFLTKDEVIFSELSPRPHDTGMVTLISQDFSEFDLHARAILGLPIPKITYHGPAAASAVILASEESTHFSISGLEEALAISDVDVRLFGKPTTRKYRRMGVALARAESIEMAVETAVLAAKKISITYA
jgi:phosphoribosylglycinamide formyltransferase 2